MTEDARPAMRIYHENAIEGLGIAPALLDLAERVVEPPARNAQQDTIDLA
jgi:hypothetical protein